MGKKGKKAEEMKIILDFSRNNPNIDWGTVMRIPNLEGVVLKASEGVTEKDPMLAVRYRAATSREIPVKGLYHFYHPADDPNQQAENYINEREAALVDKAVPAVVDIEWSESRTEWTSVPEEQRYSDLRTFLARLEAEDFEIIIYSSYAFMNKYLPKADFLLVYKLWVAWYEAAPPLLPSPWKVWTWWQYTASGNIDGIEGPVDISYVNDEVPVN